MNNAPPLLSVTDLSVSFQLEDGKELDALKGVSWHVDDGEVLALVGESGSGKSVASLAVMGLLPGNIARIKTGRIEFNGQDLLQLSNDARRDLRGGQMAMIFQDPMTSLNPVLTVHEQISEALVWHTPLRGMGGAAIAARVLELLDEVGMPEPQRIAASYPHQMSGGQQQRVMIAMALASKPRLIIADEPTTALDVTIQKQVLELMMRLQQSYRMAIVFITHDLGLVREIAHRVVVMRHGVVRETGATEAIFSAPQDAYTRALLACAPPRSGRPRRLPVIQDFLQEAGDEPAAPSAAALRPQPNTTPGGALLTVKKLNTWLGRRGLFSRQMAHIVHDVSFSVARGETLGIVGESGSGKTTLGLSLLQLHPASGEALLDGRNLLALSAAEFMPYRRRMQVIFQNPLASLNPRFTVGDILMEPLCVHRIGANTGERRQMAQQLLEQVGLARRDWNRYPHEFSGGQCQRIAIARCLTLQPEILICDESVSALDVSIQAQILNLLKDLQERLGLTYLFISHDLNVVRYLAHRILVMQHGRVIEQGDADTLCANPQHPYTKALFDAVPGLQAGLQPRSGG